MANRRLKAENRRLRSRVRGGPALPDATGPSEQTSKICADVGRVAPTNFVVIISGEAGSGKELVARAIHRQSQRASRPFVAVDCGSTAPGSAEGKLFGHEQRALAGTVRSQPGKLEQASGGTLFLNEVSMLPLSSQDRLLRTLQERGMRRVGGGRWISLDLRTVATTSRNLAVMVAAGEFHRDLYRRLNEFAIRVPPLRERREDIAFLAKRFLELANEELGRDVRGISDEALKVLWTYNWPENVRELREVIRRAVLCAGTRIGPEHLSIAGPPCENASAGTDLGEAGNASPPLKEIVRQKVRQLERDVLVQVLQMTGGNKAQAARMLQIDYKTIHTKLRQYGISV